MLANIPQIGLQKPSLVATFKCWTALLVQVVTPDTLYIAESDNALIQENDLGVINALQVTRGTGILSFWWKGDLWVAGSTQFQCIIGIPGVNTGSGLAGSESDGTNILAPMIGT